jgi:hypothetical protein
VGEGRGMVGGEREGVREGEGDKRWRTDVFVGEGEWLGEKGKG